MPVTVIRKSILIILVFAVSLSLISPAFSQGREFERSRYLSLPSSAKYSMGGAEAGDYKVMPGDLLEITVWRELELTRDVRVRPDGQFSYPLIGQVKAGGFTVTEIEEKMRKDLLTYIKFPEITVAVKETAGSTVIVLGEVFYPGIYNYKGQGDVLMAIGLAGDFTTKAKRESVLVISDNFTDKPVVRRVNVFGSFYHGTKNRSFLLKPGDVIYVPKTFIADWNKTIEDLQPTLNTLLGQDFTNFMNDREYVRTMYYNRDKPIGKEAQ